MKVVNAIDESVVMSYLATEVLDDTCVKLAFRRPDLQIPMHGFARSNIIKKFKVSVNTEQRDWLDENLYNSTGRSDVEVYQAMKQHFGSKMRKDTRDPTLLCLSYYTIEAMMKEHKALEKKDRNAVKLEAKKGF